MAQIRRLRFTLRSLLLSVTLAGVVLGWVGHSLHWIRLRHQERIASEHWIVFESDSSPRPPWGLWLCGESGVSQVYVDVPADQFATERQRAQRMFPEATIVQGRLLADR